MLAWGKRLAGRTGPLASASLRGGPAQQRVAARGIQYVVWDGGEGWDGVGLVGGLFVRLYMD